MSFLPPRTARRPGRWLGFSFPTLLLVIVLPSMAAEYFVSPRGDDTHPGTAPDLAWRTPEAVNRARFRPGDRVLFEVSGTFNKEFQGFLAFGEGVVEETELDSKDGTYHVRFRGLVHAAPYTNAIGEECLMNSPQLQTKTSGLSEFVFTP